MHLPLMAGGALDGYLDIADRRKRSGLDRAEPLRIESLEKQCTAWRDVPATREELRAAESLFAYIDQIARQEYYVECAIEHQLFDVAAHSCCGARHMTQHVRGIVHGGYRVPLVE